MLPRRNRLRDSRSFATAVRSGVRATSGRVTVHAAVRPDGPASPQVGLIVNRRVGGSVVRHRVSRVIRHSVRPILPELRQNAILVIRAHPGAASDPGLARDVVEASHLAVSRLP